MEHTHRWRKVYEEFLLGGAFPTGYECLDCKEFVSQSNIPAAGIGGVDTGQMRLHGPHGGPGRCSDGTVYKQQIAYPDGRLEIER